MPSTVTVWKLAATQVAISIDAAEVYYLNQGQNWERAAMIKARAAAGDVALGEEFLDRLPFVGHHLRHEQAGEDAVLLGHVPLDG